MDLKHNDTWIEISIEDGEVVVLQDDEDITHDFSDADLNDFAYKYKELQREEFEEMKYERKRGN